MHDDKRVVHFVLSLVLIFVINAVIGFTLGQGAARNAMQSDSFSRNDSSSSSATGSGVIGEMERQGRLVEAANADSFSPPSDGKLDEDQVEEYISVLRKTRAAHQRYKDKMDKMAADLKAKEEAGESPSLSDLTSMYGGVGTAISANNAEMEIVKSAGGNWAEYLWVKQQLRTAELQQGEGSEEIEHNWELYQEYQADLEDNS